MNQNTQTDNDNTTSDSRRSRGPNKPFPLLSFEEALELARGVSEHGIDGRIRRLTLFGNIDRSPTSSSSRILIAASYRYGLTTGSYNADYLEITGDGKFILNKESPTQERIQKQFDISIVRFEPFLQVYDRLKNKRIPAPDVLRDELAEAGIAPTDSESASEIFLANCKSVGLIRNISGSETLISIDQTIEESHNNNVIVTPAPLVSDATGITQGAAPILIEEPIPKVAVTDPSVHIDSSATAEQINEIFKSMGRYLYGRDVD